MPEAKHLHLVACCLMGTSFIFQIVAMAMDTGMWSTDYSVDTMSLGGCGLFGCDGPAVCGCSTLGCSSESCITNAAKGCPKKVSDVFCSALAGHMAAAQACSVVTIMGMIVALVLCILKVTPLADKIPDSVMNMRQCIHIMCAVCSLICFALVAAAYDQEFCGCVVKDMESTLSVGFVFLVLNFIFQVICAVLAGASQAMEGSSTGDYNSYSA